MRHPTPKHMGGRDYNLRCRADVLLALVAAHPDRWRLEPGTERRAREDVRSGRQRVTDWYLSCR